MYLETLDIVVVAIYGSSLFVIALCVSRDLAGHRKVTKDYFLAG